MYFETTDARWDAWSLRLSGVWSKYFIHHEQNRRESVGEIFTAKCEGCTLAHIETCFLLQGSLALLQGKHKVILREKQQQKGSLNTYHDG